MLFFRILSRLRQNQYGLEFSEWYAGHYHVESEECGIRIMFEDFDEICEEE